MSQFPTNKTVPLTGDIGVEAALPAPASTSTRQPLTEVLQSLNSAIQTSTNNSTTAINNEATARQQADQNLQSQINTEITNRQNADNTITTNYQAADAAEATARQNADTVLQNEIDGERSPLRVTASGSTTTISVAAALANRIGSAGTAQGSLGVPSGVYQSDFSGATLDFLQGTISYANQSGILLSQTTNDTSILTSYNQFSTITTTKYGFYFTSTATASIGSVSFRLGASGPITGVSIKAYAYLDNGSGSPGSQIGASATSTVNLTTTKTDYTLTFASPISITSGQKYYILLGVGHSNTFNVAYIYGSPNGTDAQSQSGYVYTSDGTNYSVGGLTAGNDPYYTLTLAGTGGPSAGTFTTGSYTGQANNYTKYSVVLLPTSPDTLLVTWAGAWASTASAVPAPVVTGGVPIAVVTVQANPTATGLINIAQSNIVQFVAAGSGGGGSGAGSPLDPQADELFTYYTRSDFSVDKKQFLGSTTGTESILGLKKISLASGQNFISSDLTGAQFRNDNVVINAAQARLMYNVGKVDLTPTVQISRDGGNSYTTATLSYPGSDSASSPTSVYQGNIIEADATFGAASTLFDSGTTNGSFSTGSSVAEIFSPTYRTIVSQVQIYVKTTATTGSIVGKIYKVANGTPTTVVSTSFETFVAGQDVTSTAQYVSFTFKSPALEAGTQYALSIEGTGLNAVLQVGQITGTSAFALSSATNQGSGWSASATNLAFRVLGTGGDLRLKVTASAASELIGFGMEYVTDTPQAVRGDASYEARTLTYAEATTGTITLNIVRYTPGAHQLLAIASNHLLTAPVDFVESSSSTVQFPANFFQQGDTVVFFTAYGLVDGSSQSLGKINSIYDAVVGTAAQAAAGYATHTSLQTAINNTPAGGFIVLLGSVTENITLSKNMIIEGKGYGSTINGTVTVSGNYATLRDLRFGGNVTITGSGNFIRDSFLASTASVSDTGTANSKLIISE